MKNSKKHLTPIRLAGALLAASALLAGCWEQSATQLVESGKARMQKKEFKGAAIEFKNALQKDGSLVEARFLLGKALLESGDPQGAWVELSKARDAGYDNDELVPPMAATLILRGQVDKFVAEYADVELTAPKRQAELKAALATAYGSQGKYVQARAAADAALQADAGNVVAQLAVARLLLIGGDKQGAIAQIDRTLKAHPESPSPWLARAETLQLSGADAAEAMAAYRETLKRDATNLQAHVGVFGLLWKQRDLAGMDQQLQDLRKALPGTPFINYFSATLALERKDLKTAQENAQQLLKVVPDAPRFLHLAGMIEYERGSYLQAAAHLGKAVSIGAVSPVATRTLLARALLRGGDPRKALTAVQPLFDGKSTPPAEVYSVAADAHLQLGESAEAKKLYAQAIKSNPKDTHGRTALALVDLEAGRTDQAMAELKSVATDDEGAQAEVLMLMSHLRANQLDQATQIVTALEKKQPDRPIAPYFRGRIEAQLGQLDKARESLELAVKRAPNYLPAVAMLANLDLQAGKPQAAVARYEKLVAADPRSVAALMGLIELRANSGAKTAEIRSQLDAAIKQFPEADAPRLALAGSLMAAREYKQAIQVIQDGIARSPDSPRFQEMLGSIQLAAGDINQASQAFSKMASLQPNSVAPLMHLAQVQVARKDAPAAISQLRKVLAIKPGHPPATGMLVTLLARTGKIDEALAIAKDVQVKQPGEPVGWVMEGDLQVSKGNRAAAVTAYRSALTKRPLGEVAVKLHRAMLDAGQNADAGKFENDWVLKQPEDSMFNYYLGDRALAAGEYERAEALFLKSLAKAPQNAVAMNNLAWLMQRAGKPGALEMAEKALTLQPNNAAFLDTAAEIYAATNKLDKALPLQKRALELEPQQPMHRLHLAQYLAKSGQKSEARQQLQTLSQLGASFPRQDEVQKLLSSL
jgi:cellulose synthase operon protein C